MCPLPDALNKINKLTQDICYTHKELVHIPRQDSIVDVEMTPSEMKKYKQFEKDMVLEEVTATNATALANKLLQLSNGAMYYDKGVINIHDHKLEALESVIEEANGSPVLVMYQFIFDKDKILNRFKGARQLNTEQDVLDWNKGLIPIAVAHPLSCGHGLNLQEGGNILCWYSLTYSLEQFQQAEARLIRQGQKKKVYVYYLVTKGTRDERLLPLLKGKATNQRELLNLYLTN